MKKWIAILMLVCMMCNLLGMNVFAAAKEDSFQVTAVSTGVGTNSIRFVVPVNQFPMEVTENSLAGYKVKAELVNLSDSNVKYNLDSTILTNEMRDGGRTVLAVEATAAAPSRPKGEDTYNNYTLNLTISKPEPVKLPEPPAGYTGAPTIFVKAQDFKEHPGSWNIVPPEVGATLEILKSNASSLQSAKSAQVSIYVPKDGTYKVYARARDYEAFASSNGSLVESGTRFFHIAVGGNRFDTVIGDHGESRFAWEEVGSVTLKEGRTPIEVFDTSAFYGRLEGIILTTNDNLPLPETAEEIQKMTETYPAWVLPYLSTDFETKTESSDTPSVEAKPVEFKEGYNYYVYTPETFKNSLGSWEITNQDTKNSVLPNIMVGSNDNKDSSNNPATAKFGIPKDGFYKVMVHTRDFASMPGTRLFKVKAGENPDIVFGALGKDAWGWQESAVLPFSSGEKLLKVMDYKGYNARVDMIIITDDLYFKVDDSVENFKELSKKQYVPGSVKQQVQDNAGRPADEIAVKLNGEYMQFDVPPILMNDRTMVPFRAIFEALGCDVQWDNDNQTAIGIRNGKTIMLPIGDSMARIDNEGKFMDQPAIVVNDRTLVPLRFVSEALGANVEWIDETQTVVIMARVTPRTYWFVPSSFKELGTWSFETGVSGAFDGKALRGMHPNVGNPTPKDADPSKTKPAKVTFDAPESGTYTLWARSKDFQYNQQGTRKFQIEVNGKRVDAEFGTHGKTGFIWMRAGEVSVKEGENELSLIDTSAFGARCDAILLTEDPNYVPPENMNSMYVVASPFNPTSGKSAGFPQYAKDQAEPTQEIVLENEEVKVVFYSVPTAKGPVIQNEIYAKQNGQYVLTKERKEELGYVVISAENAQEMVPSEDKYTFSTQFKEDGISRLYAGNDLYASGLKTWFVPIGMEKIADNQLKLLFEDKDGVSLEVIWSLDETKTPLVTMNMVANKEGFYTMGGWEGSEMAYDDISFALAPYRVQGKRIHDDKCLLIEQYLFTPMGTYTTTKNGVQVTKGVVVEPSFIPLRWVYNDNGIFGINMKGVYGNYRASAFAPVLGTEDSKMNAGDSYTFKYRIVSTPGDWFDTYKYVTQELFDVSDYRENVNTSLTTAIFNTRKLMMDDYYGGWDANNMEHYNMEGMNVTSQGNPMYAMQQYLLTEDENVLTERAIPTIASTLTRGDIHFNSTDRKGGLSYWSFKELPMPIGEPIAGFNANVYGGMYEMTRGMVPFLHEYALEKGTSEVTNSYGSIASFSNLLNMYKYTGDKTYLDKAIADADKYLEEVVYATPTSMIGWSSFINISYFPNLASLIDIYEITGEQRFLDAAEEVARYLATTLWVPGLDGEKKNGTVVANDINEIMKWNGDADRDGNDSWWAGDKRFRVGRPGEHFSDLSSNVNITKLTGEVPSWIPSRVGLGLEQSSTFQGASGHITMNTWAGDLMRLSLYTDDEYYEMLARNVIIGRFSNYPGYKLTGFTTYQQTEQYPYEGPDYTAIYAHHITPFLAMLEDFLINQTLLWSNGNIKFPSLRQQGYAYFNSNQYGHEAGKFYDEENMWAWLDEGIVETGNIQIDFMAAKKDGAVGIAFMNESQQDVTTTISLGEKIGAYTGSATLYDKTGNIGTVMFTDGKAELTIPARALKAIIIKTDAVKAPAFSKVEYSTTNSKIENTVSTHTNGKGYVLQMSPDGYYAYVYVTDKPNTTKNVTLSYSIGGETMTMTDDVYPYEFIVKVDDATKPFKYTLSSELLTGEKVSGGSGTLQPLN